MELKPDYSVSPDVRALNVDADRGYRVWNKNEIYFGGGLEASKGLYVPNVGDKVDSYEGNTLTEYVVVSVDPSTLIPTLSELHRAKKDDLDINQFKGVGYAGNPSAWRIWLDTNVVPHTLVVDTNYIVHGSEATHVKLFRGTNTSPTGSVISQYRDRPANQFSESVPLYPISDRHDGSIAMKRVPVCHTTETMDVGEVVTAVIYGAGGNVFSEQRFLVAHGANIRKLTDEQKYVMGIELISPYLSQTEDKLIEIPTNLPMKDLFTMAKVMYSDGTERTLSITGERFAILGLDYFVATRHGETNHFALRYQLAENEHAWNTNVGENRHITEIYRYRTMKVDGSYTVQLALLPLWDSQKETWDLRYYLHSLDRDVAVDVTTYIEQGVNSDIFNGRRFGVTQHMTVALQLERLNIGLNKFRYIQQFDIGLNGPPQNYNSPYLINYSNNQPIAYGEYNRVGLKTTTQVTSRIINLNALVGATDFAQWLDRTYYAAEPAFDNTIEQRAPAPTHLVIRTPDFTVEKEVTTSNWNTDITIDNVGETMTSNSTIFVEFIRKQANTIQYLTMLPFILKPTV